MRFLVSARVVEHGDDQSNHMLYRCFNLALRRQTAAHEQAPGGGSSVGPVIIISSSYHYQSPSRPIIIIIIIITIILIIFISSSGSITLQHHHRHHHQAACKWPRWARGFAIAHFQAVCTVAGLGLFADTVVYLFPLQLRALR